MERVRGGVGDLGGDDRDGDGVIVGEVDGRRKRVGRRAAGDGGGDAAGERAVDGEPAGSDGHGLVEGDGDRGISGDPGGGGDGGGSGDRRDERGACGRVERDLEIVDAPVGGVGCGAASAAVTVDAESDGGAGRASDGGKGR